MTLRYVGAGGNDGNTGLSWAQRKLTLNGAEDTPVVAGDTVYVAPGVYRELLTCDVSGGAGTPITYIGDYGGTHTDGVGGVVRITGSNNDQTATRSNCVAANSKHYRTFSSSILDTTTSSIVSAIACTNWTISNCFVTNGTANGISMSGATGAHTIQSCAFQIYANGVSVHFTHSGTYDNSSDLVQNCLFLSGYGIQSTRVGGITVRNCGLLGCLRAINIATALTVGQTIAVNNCTIGYGWYGVVGTVLGEIIENYNAFYGNITDRANTAVGANSLAYPPLFDARWLFEIVGGGRMLSPFDLGQWSQLINVAGTSPTTTDMRGTGAIGGVREWGALEYDPTLLLKGGGVSRARILGGV